MNERSEMEINGVFVLKNKSIELYQAKENFGLYIEAN